MRIVTVGSMEMWEEMCWTPDERKKREKMLNSGTSSDVPNSEVRFMFMGQEEYLAYLQHKEKPGRKEEED